MESREFNSEVHHSWLNGEERAMSARVEDVGR